MKATRSLKWWICLLLILSQLPVSAVMMIFPEKRRLSILEDFEFLVSYSTPLPEELRLVPDPFVFGREIEEEKPEPILEGLSNEEVLAILAGQIRNSIVGFQEFGDKSFLATRDFGLLRDGDTVIMPLPENPGGTVTVTIVSPSREGLTLQMEDLQTFVSLDSANSGVTTSSP